MNDKIILYLGGGAMSGVYGAGVLKKLHDAGMVTKVEAIYAGSVGALNASYLLSGQAEIGPQIYWENLQKGFIFPFNLVIGTGFLFINRFVWKLPKEMAPNVVDINYIYDLITRTKRINIKAIASHDTKLYIKVLNVDNGELEYLKFQDNPSFDLIRAAITVKPYFFEETVVNNKRYVDATMKEPVGLSFLIKKYPGQKIVVILNEPVKRGLRHYLKNLTEGTVCGLYPYPISLFKMFLNREASIRSDIKKALNHPDILLLHPGLPRRARPRTISPSILKQTFENGYQDGERIAEFI